MSIKAAETLTNKRLFADVRVVCEPFPKTTDRIRKKELIIKLRIQKDRAAERTSNECRIS